MASLAITKDQLIGSASTMALAGRSAQAASMEFHFPGLLNNNVFITPLGGLGETWQFEGILRTAAVASQALAAQALKTIIDGDGLAVASLTSGLLFFQRNATLLNFLAADSSGFSVFHQGSTTPGIDNVIIPAGGLEFGRPEMARIGATYVKTQPYRLAIRRLF